MPTIGTWFCTLSWYIALKSPPVCGGIEPAS